MVGLWQTTEPNHIFYWDYNRFKARSGWSHALGGRMLFWWQMCKSQYMSDVQTTVPDRGTKQSTWQRYKAQYMRGVQITVPERGTYHSVIHRYKTQYLTEEETQYLTEVLEDICKPRCVPRGVNYQACKHACIWCNVCVSNWYTLKKVAQINYLK